MLRYHLDRTRFRLIEASRDITFTQTKIEELVQNPTNLTAMVQTLYDLIRSERFVTYPDAKLRDAVTRSVFEETGSGLRFAKHQPIKIDQ
jgi:hypothetical protein